MALPSFPTFRSFSSSTPIRIAIAFALAVVIGHPTPIAAEDAAKDVQALLALPMTPGSVGLLVPHVMSPEVQKRLIEAVKHEDPAVRAVAARIAFVTTSRGLLPPLIATVAKEQHVPTAVEQIRALTAFMGAPGDSLVMRHVARFGGPAAAAMAEVLARTRPADLMTHLPALLAASPGEPEGLAGPLAAAVAQHPAAANDILQAVLATGDLDLWEALVGSTTLNTDVALPPAVLVQALKSSEPRLRTQVVWHIFAAVHSGDAVSDEVLAAAAPRPDVATTAAADLTLEDFGREMLSRARKNPPSKADWVGYLSLEKGNVRFKANASGAASAYLTSDEAKVLDVSEDSRRLARVTRRAGADGQTRSNVMRTIPVFAKGLIGDLLSVTGCRPPNELHFAAGEVTYRQAGGPQKISILKTTTLSEECDRFVSTMMQLSIAQAERPITPDTADHIVLLFNRQYLTCADDPFPLVRPRFTSGSKIVPPQRKRSADIQYPAAAQRAQLAGVVILGVRLTHKGCIASAETIRSVNPLFDLAAIRGVFSAEYTPALVDGQPVEIQINYTVNFRP